MGTIGSSLAEAFWMFYETLWALVLGFGLPLQAVAFSTLLQRRTPGPLMGRASAATHVLIGGPLLLFRNTSRGGHWLDVALARFAPGARVTVDGVTQEVHAGSSYLSSEDPRLHFGLGGKTRVAELTVAWPGGKITRMRNVRADRIVEVKP